MKRSHVLIGAAALAALLACGDPYLHTNPYDPVFPVEFTITGPDTLFSLFEVGQFTVQTKPTWSDTGFVWQTDTLTNYFIVPMPCQPQTVDGATVLKGNGTGAYTSIAPPLEPYVFKVAISVSVGAIDTTIQVGGCGAGLPVQTRAVRHTGYKTVVVTQRITRIQLRCPDTHACAPLNAGDTVSIFADAFDALGHQPVAVSKPPYSNFTLDSFPHPPGTLIPVVTFLSRDSTTATVHLTAASVSRVTGLKSGTTWVVATRGVAIDSLQVVVH